MASGVRSETQDVGPVGSNISFAFSVFSNQCGFLLFLRELVEGEGDPGMFRARCALPAAVCLCGPSTTYYLFLPNTSVYRRAYIIHAHTAYLMAEAGNLLLLGRPLPRTPQRELHGYSVPKGIH